MIVEGYSEDIVGEAARLAIEGKAVLLGENFPPAEHVCTGSTEEAVSEIYVESDSRLP